jgi:hypothetical protein
MVAKRSEGKLQHDCALGIMEMNASRMTAMVLVVLLLAYPLSIGPVTRFCFGRYVEDGWPDSIKSFYAPLWWCRQFKPLDVAIEHYSQWWIPRGEGEP